jgi:hypothetical protein
MFQTRTQRKMDERVQKNIAEMKKMEEELKNVTINKEIVKLIPEETAEVYRCILTQTPWTDLVCDDQQSRDVVGFGLAVERNECTLLLLMLLCVDSFDLKFQTIQ